MLEIKEKILVKGEKCRKNEKLFAKGNETLNQI